MNVEMLFLQKFAIKALNIPIKDENGDDYDKSELSIEINKKYHAALESDRELETAKKVCVRKYVAVALFILLWAVASITVQLVLGAIRAAS